MLSLFKKIIFIVFISLILNPISYAHEMQPGLIDIKQLTHEKFEINWRAPIYYKKPHPASLVLPEHWQVLLKQAPRKVDDSYLHSQLVNIPDGENALGKIIIKGLELTITEVFVRILWLDKKPSSFLVLPDNPWFALTDQRSVWQLSGDYIVLGINHILEGYDHLSFVLMLMWIITVRKKLLITITSFTFAHSLTLAAASLGFVSLLGPPVEVIIALSIIFMASELLKIKQGKESLTANYPWMVAFMIGLLHGFGFSGALSEIGLPETDILLALVCINVGVEIGQLMFIAAILLLSAAINKINITRPTWVNNIPIYAVGSMASFWFIERMSQF